MVIVKFGGIETTYFSHINPGSNTGIRRIPDSIRHLVANWNHDGSAEISGYPICKAHVEQMQNGNYKVSLYASGYYIGRMGMYTVFAMETTCSGKVLKRWKYQQGQLMEA